MSGTRVEPQSRPAAYRAAIRLLEARDRAISDLRARLIARGFDGDCVEDTLARLRREGFLDDERFAQRYAESVRASRGHGSVRVRADLIRRGIAPDLAAEAARDHPESEWSRAFELACKRAGRLPPGIAHEAAMRRLVSYLARKGFGAETVWATAKRALERSR